MSLIDVLTIYESRNSSYTGLDIHFDLVPCFGPLYNRGFYETRTMGAVSVLKYWEEKLFSLSDKNIKNKYFNFNDLVIDNDFTPQY